MKKHSVKRFIPILLILVLITSSLGIAPVYAAETVWTVTSSADSGAGSLRDILDNKAQDGDTIVFAENISTILLTSDTLSFEQNDLTIDGGETRVCIKRGGEIGRAHV